MAVVRTPSGARIDTGFLGEGTTRAGGTTVTVGGSGNVTVRGGGSVDQSTVTNPVTVVEEKSTTITGQETAKELIQKTQELGGSLEAQQKVVEAYRNQQIRQQMFNDVTQRQQESTATQPQARTPQIPEKSLLTEKSDIQPKSESKPSAVLYQELFNEKSITAI